MLLFSSFQSKDVINSEWSSLFWIDILLPWITGVGVTILVIKKNGKDLKREIWNPIIPRMPRVVPKAAMPLAVMPLPHVTQYDEPDLNKS